MMTVMAVFVCLLSLTVQVPQMPQNDVRVNVQTVPAQNSPDFIRMYIEHQDVSYYMTNDPYEQLQQRNGSAESFKKMLEEINEMYMFNPDLPNYPGPKD